MRISLAVLAFAALLLAAFSTAAFVKLLNPVQQTITAGENPVVYLGMVGPGQKVELVVDNDTGEPTYGGITTSKSDANWDILAVDNTTLPPGWIGQASGLYENPLKAYVIAAPDAPDGDYQFDLLAVNNYGDVLPMRFTAKATVSRHVFSMSLVSDPVKVGIGEPAVYQVQLYNSGSANDVFQLTASGIPGEPAVTQQVFVPMESKVTATLAISSKEAGSYPIDFYASSLSSAAINSQATTTLFVGSSMLTDAQASSRGILLFPSAESYLYSLWSLFGSFLS